MEDKHRELIINNHSKLVELTDDDVIDGIIEMLKEKAVFSDIILNYIKNQKEINEKKKIFYEKIIRRGPDAFKHLYDIYMVLGQKELADILRPSLADEIEVRKSPRRMDIHQESIYKMISKPRGYMLLINIKNFLGEKERLGSEKDEANLTKLWEQLGYNVILYRDLDTKTFMKEVCKFRDMKEHNDVDSTAVFIMTHGELDENNPRNIRLKTKCGPDINSSTIIEQFYVSKCQALKDKPKLFFFQTCRGEEMDEGVHIDGVIENSPKKSDILVAYATCPGYVSVRHVDLGAYFVRTICSVFEKSSCDTDLCTMLEKVNRELKVIRTPYGYQNVHVEKSYFSKKFYFNPGIEED